jgi:hypothetical protein
MTMQEIIPKITALSKSNGRVICVLSVLGAVQEATLLLSSGVTSYHKVQLLFPYGIWGGKHCSKFNTPPPPI